MTQMTSAVLNEMEAELIGLAFESRVELRFIN